MKKSVSRVGLATKIYAEIVNTAIKDENRFYTLIPVQWPWSEERHNSSSTDFEHKLFPYQETSSITINLLKQ